MRTLSIKYFGHMKVWYKNNNGIPNTPNSHSTTHDYIEYSLLFGNFGSKIIGPVIFHNTLTFDHYLNLRQNSIK